MERSHEFSEEKNGVVFKLPIGFRFQPTDQELVLHYLTRKVFSLPLPVAVIPELDVFHQNPWDLPGELKEKRYFFCKKKTSSNLSTGCGRWKGCHKETQILGNNLVIGIKKSYVFHKKGTANYTRPLKTQWVLQEFWLVASLTTPYSTQKIMMQAGDWAACCVFQRKRKSRRGGVGKLRCSSPPCSPSSSSTGLTQM